MKTLAAIIMATQPAQPVHLAQNAPQVQQMHMNARVPEYCHFGNAVPVAKDALTMAVRCNTSSVLFLRFQDEREIKKMLPLIVHVGGHKTEITESNYDMTPIAQLPPMYRDIRIMVTTTQSRPTVLPRISFVVRAAE